jgi:hypothetical protein
MKESENKTEQQEITSKFIKTKGGYDAIEQNGIIIRKSESKKRLHDDGETYDEYKIRMKFLAGIEKQLKEEKAKRPFWQSRFSIAGQNYVATYNKSKVEEALKKQEEEKQQTENK